MFQSVLYGIALEIKKQGDLYAVNLSQIVIAIIVDIEVILLPEQV